MECEGRGGDGVRGEGRGWSARGVHAGDKRSGSITMDKLPVAHIERKNKITRIHACDMEIEWTGHYRGIHGQVASRCTGRFTGRVGGAPARHSGWSPGKGLAPVGSRLRRTWSVQSPVVDRTHPLG